MECNLLPNLAYQSFDTQFQQRIGYSFHRLLKPFHLITNLFIKRQSMHNLILAKSKKSIKTGESVEAPVSTNGTITTLREDKQLW